MLFSLEIRSFYSNASIPVDGTNLKPGNLVVVQHDEVFARARILSINEPESNVQLRCVDSGRRLTAALNCIFKIDAQFTELPEFSMRCSMPNIEPINPVHGRRVQHWSEQTRYEPIIYRYRLVD